MIQHLFAVNLCITLKNFIIIIVVLHHTGFPSGSAGKESTCNAGDSRHMGSIPGSGRSPGEGNGTHSSILVWRIPWTEKLGGLQSMGSQIVRHDWSNLAHVMKISILFIIILVSQPGNSFIYCLLSPTLSNEWWPLKHHLENKSLDEKMETLI